MHESPRVMIVHFLIASHNCFDLCTRASNETKQTQVCFSKKKCSLAGPLFGKSVSLEPRLSFVGGAEREPGFEAKSASVVTIVPARGGAFPQSFQCTNQTEQDVYWYTIIIISVLAIKDFVHRFGNR